MDKTDRDLVSVILAAALELPKIERDALVQASSSGRPDLQQEVESLLKANTTDVDFVERPAFVLGTAENPAPLPVGRSSFGS